jgi:hypothetical protein
MSRVAAGVVLLLSLSASPLFAQSGFVQGGLALDARRFSGQPDNRVFDANASTIMIGAGGFLTPAFSAGVEIDFAGESETSESTSVAVAGRPATVTTTFTSRRRSVAALFGVHSSAQRKVRVGAYAGLAFTALDQRIATDAPPIVLSTPPPPSEFTHRGAMPIVAVDVAIAVAPHVSIVGAVRAQSLGFGNELSGFSIRPGAAVRITF